MNENLDLVTCLEWNSKQQNVLSVQRSSSVQQEVLAVEQVRKGLEKPEALCKTSRLNMSSPCLTLCWFS